MEINSYINVEISDGKSEQNAAKIKSNLDAINEKQKKVKTSTKQSKDEIEGFGRSTEKQTDRAKQGFRTLGDQVDRANQKIKRSATDSLKSLVAYSAGAVSAVAAIREMVKAYSEFETGLLGVAKTTGLAGKDLDDFAKRIETISTQIPVSTNELLELAQAAGQMGVKGKANLEAFSVTVAKLGRTSDLAGEEAAKALARILNVTGENINSIGTLGSVIVALGNNIAATESEIAHMTNEVARSTSVFGVTSAEAAALGGAMSAIGVQAQLGGSSLGRSMVAIQEAIAGGEASVNEFASALGLSGAALQEAFQRDKIEGLMMFLEGVESQGLNAVSALDAIGLGGQFTAKSIVPLANNLDILRETLALANAEVENATALDAEFAAVLGSFDNQLQIFKNNIEDSARAMAREFMPAVTDMIRGLNEMNWDPVVSGAKTLATIIGSGGALYAASVALPPLFAAASTAAGALAANIGLVTWSAKSGVPIWNIMNTSFAGTSVAADLAAKKITLLNVAVKGLFAGFVGFQIGTWLSDNFEEARVAGIAFVGAMMNGYERLKFAGNVLWETFSSGFGAATLHIRRGYQDLLNIMAKGLDALGADQLAAGYRTFADSIDVTSGSADGLRDTIDRLTREMDANIDANNQLVDDMIAYEATSGHAASTTNVLATEVEEAGDALSNLTDETEEATSGLTEYEKSVSDLVSSLSEEIATLGLSGRELEIYNAEKVLAVGNNEEHREAVLAIINALYDEKDAIDEATESQKEGERAAKEIAKANERAAEEIRDQWLKTRDAISDMFVDSLLNGENFFDSMAKSFEKMLAKMVGDLLASNILNMFGFGGGSFGVTMPGGIGGGVAGGIGSSVTSSIISGSFGGGAGFAGGLSGMFGSAGLSGFAQGLFGFGQGAAGFMGPMTGSAMAGSQLAALATGPVGIAIAAAAALKGIHDKTSDPDGFKREIEGFLGAPTPGAPTANQFSVEAFDSGFTPIGFSEANRQRAEQIIEQFRFVDSTLVELIEAAGGTINMSKATLGGFGVDGTGSGTLFGGSQKLTDSQLGSQLDSYARQVLAHASGIENVQGNSFQEIVDNLGVQVDKHEVELGIQEAQDEKLKKVIDHLDRSNELIRNGNGDLIDTSGRVVATNDYIGQLLETMPQDLAAAIESYETRAANRAEIQAQRDSSKRSSASVSALTSAVNSVLSPDKGVIPTNLEDAKKSGVDLRGTHFVDGELVSGQRSFAEDARQKRVSDNLLMSQFGYSFSTGTWDESKGGHSAYWTEKQILNGLRVREPEMQMMDNPVLARRGTGIIRSDNTPAMLHEGEQVLNRDQVAANRQLSDRMASLESKIGYQLGLSNLYLRKLAKINEQWEDDGLPKTRTV